MAVDDPAGSAPDLGRPAPLSFAQRRLWFIDQLDSGNPAYNIAHHYRITGPLDRDLLAVAWARVLARHEALRTSFPAADGEPWQQVSTAPDGCVPVTDLAAVPGPERRGELASIARAEAAYRFDLGTGPLVRVRLIVAGADEHHLLLTVHHSVADGWSVRIVVRDLLTIYDEVSGRPVTPLPPLPVTGRLLAAVERAHTGREDLDFWVERLAGLPDAIDLPTDRPRPSRASLRGDHIRFRLEPAVARAIHATGRAHRGTPFAVLLAAFAVLLARYADQSDIAVGVPVAGRSGPDLADVVGLLLNTVVLRVDLGADPSFGTLVSRTAGEVMAAIEHAATPFDAIVTELGTGRDLGRNPLFQVMLSFDNAPPLPPRAYGLRCEHAGGEPVIAKFDLNLIVTPAAGGYDCSLSYATDLFDRARMAALVRHFRTLLAAALARPGRPVSLLPLLDADDDVDAERCNATGTDVERAPLPALVARQVDRDPDASAVGVDGRWLRRGEFGAAVGGLADRLRAAGVTTDTIVGVCLPRGLEMLTAVHAVVAAGGAYLPLEPDDPGDRLARMIRDVDARWLVTTTDLAARLALDPPVRVLCTDRGETTDRLSEDRAAVPPIRGDALAGDALADDALAYVIYTSGSTGAPKAVGVSHRAIANRIQWMARTFPLTRTDRVLVKTPFTFDVSVWELFWPLAVGAGVYLATPDGHRDTDYLLDVIERERITTVHFVPSMLDAFLDGTDLRRRARHLRRVIASGEVLSPDLVARFVRLLPDVDLFNLYGPTETAVDVSWHDCRATATATATSTSTSTAATVPIGRPVANTRLEVLDRRLQRVPVGVRGELCVAGVQLARGYLGCPGATAQRFVPDPYGPAGARMYRTGDIAVRRVDGALEYVGRRDGQVKINGRRIELGEVEAALCELPEVRSAAVAVHQHGEARRLVAYLVLVDGRDTEPTADNGSTAGVDWRARLRDTLPDHLIPTAFIAVDRLPTTANGKLDRAALPVPAVHPTGVDHVEPGGAAQTAIAAAWRAVLDLDRVSAADDFFAVGGDSIRSLRVIARLRADGWDVRLQDLFAHPMLSDLGGILRRATDVPCDVAAPAQPFSMLDVRARERLLTRRRHQP